MISNCMSSFYLTCLSISSTVTLMFFNCQTSYLMFNHYIYVRCMSNYSLTSRFYWWLFPFIIYKYSVGYNSICVHSLTGFFSLFLSLFFFQSNPFSLMMMVVSSLCCRSFFISLATSFVALCASFFNRIKKKQ
jgi:hypothetical protein